MRSRPSERELQTLLARKNNTARGRGWVERLHTERNSVSEHALAVDFDLLHRNGAVFSPSGRYRYALYRRWTAQLFTPQHKACCFIMLNPSSAGFHGEDDPTITRCLGFSHSWQCSELYVVNLFAYIATRPTDLNKRIHGYDGNADVFGPSNQEWVTAVVNRVRASDGHVVAAWGEHGNLFHQDAAVLGWLGRPDYVQCLALTKANNPRHPLYMAAKTPLKRFEVPDVR